MRTGAGTPRIAARVLFWLMLLYVAAVTLSPIAYRPETPFGPDAERFAAFAVVSALAVIAYPSHPLRWIAGLVLVAGLLEAGQTLVDGRHGRLGDAAVKASGVLLGALIALGMEHLMARARTGVPPRPRR